MIIDDEFIKRRFFDECVAAYDAAVFKKQQQEQARQKQIYEMHYEQYSKAKEFIRELGEIPIAPDHFYSAQSDLTAYFKISDRIQLFVTIREKNGQYSLLPKWALNYNGQFYLFDNPKLAFGLGFKLAENPEVKPQSL